MGDEITIPMNNLEEMLSLINQHDHSSNVKELLVIASQAAHSLIENITNIIELNKLDANLYELPKARIMTDELIEKVFLKQENTALSKSLLLEKELGYGVPKSFIANEQAVSKILNNLMSNALRFTSEGSVELKIETATQDEKAMLKFTVSDTGVGIPPEALESIFDSLDKDTKLKNSSFTGRLRLIVCKQLAELMGGTMGVRSVEGEGSQFWFTIAIV